MKEKERGTLKIEFRGNVPQKAHDTDGAFDLRAKEDAVIMGGTVTKVQTGTYMNIPPGYVGLLFSRSGHGAKFGVRLANSVGVVDAGYQGDITAALTKDTDGMYVIKAGDRVAQLMILPIPQIELVEVESFTESQRGTNGFGSTGVE